MQVRAFERYITLKHAYKKYTEGLQKRNTWIAASINVSKMFKSIHLLVAHEKLFHLNELMYGSSVWYDKMLHLSESFPTSLNQVTQEASKLCHRLCWSPRNHSHINWQVCDVAC